MKRRFWSRHGPLSPQSGGGSQRERSIPQTENSKTLFSSYRLGPGAGPGRAGGCARCTRVSCGGVEGGIGANVRVSPAAHGPGLEATSMLSVRAEPVSAEARSGTV